MDNFLLTIVSIFLFVIVSVVGVVGVAAFICAFDAFIDYWT